MASVWSIRTKGRLFVNEPTPNINEKSMSVNVSLLTFLGGGEFEVLHHKERTQVVCTSVMQDYSRASSRDSVSPIFVFLQTQAGFLTRNRLKHYLCLLSHSFNRGKGQFSHHFIKGKLHVKG